MSNDKFKIGDKVVLTKNWQGTAFVGATATVTGYTNGTGEYSHVRYVQVRWDKNNPKWNGVIDGGFHEHQFELYVESEKGVFHVYNGKNVFRGASETEAGAIAMAKDLVGAGETMTIYKAVAKVHRPPLDIVVKKL